jgi:hypothetical protein
VKKNPLQFNLGEDEAVVVQKNPPQSDLGEEEAAVVLF